MDLATWAIWYDLPEGKGGEDYVKWAHEEYLPALRKRDGVMWVAHYKNVDGGPAMKHGRTSAARPSDPAVPTGTQWVQIVGAASPLVFISPGVVAQEAAETGKTREMLDRRISPQTFIFAEVMRVNGPAYTKRTPGTVPGPAIQFGSIQMRDREGEHILGKWYADTRFPLISRIPGAIGCRVMSTLYGWSKYGVIYEFDSLESRLEHFEPVETAGIMDGKPQNPIRGRNIHAWGSPIVGERVWPPVKS